MAHVGFEPSLQRKQGLLHTSPGWHASGRRLLAESGRSFLRDLHWWPDVVLVPVVGTFWSSGFQVLAVFLECFVFSCGGLRPLMMIT